MDFADFCCNIASQIGELAGKSHNTLSSAQKKLKDSAQALNPKTLPERIQKSIYEKLTRTLYKQAEFMMGKISQRMEVIDEVARPFYEKISVMAAHGPVSETRLWDAINSIETAKKLTEEEKTLLVTLFGQIVGAQKSKVVDAVVVEKQAQSAVKNKKAALTGKSNAN